MDNTPILGCGGNNTTQWRPNKHIPTGEVMKVITEAFGGVIRLIESKDEAKRTIWPTYGGTDYEDPERFFEKLERVFRKENIDRQDWRE